MLLIQSNLPVDVFSMEYEVTQTDNRLFISCTARAPAISRSRCSISHWLRYKLQDASHCTHSTRRVNSSLPLTFASFRNDRWHTALSLTRVPPAKALRRPLGQERSIAAAHPTPQLASPTSCPSTICVASKPCGLDGCGLPDHDARPPLLSFRSHS